MDTGETEIIGKYELLREIGAGSMGRVYLTRDPFTQEDLAIKIADEEQGYSERGERRRRKLFLNEVKAAGMLRHPNIIATVDAGIDEGRRYIVMEYVSAARTLDEFANPKQLLPVGKVVKIIQACASALDYAHSKGVIHRDIKPKNVMLNQQGEVKICDFGVALIDRADVEETQVVGRVGSPRYMAPEQLMADVATNQSDIFSLGVLLYELLTGVSPFAGSTVADIARKILREPHRPVRELRPEIPEELAGIVERTLKKHPAGRYRTAMELAGDLSLIADELEFKSLQRVGLGAVRQLEALPGFYGFSREQLEEILAVAVWEEFDVGALIATEGQGDANAMVMVEGSAAVQCGGIRLARMQRGASFGDFGLVEAGELGAEIRAIDPCCVIRIGAMQAERLSPECRQRFYRTLAAGYAGRLQQLQRRIHRRKGK